MAKRKGSAERWPPALAVFRPEDWPPTGELVESCGCRPCRDRWGPPAPAGTSVADARRRWRLARQAALERGSSEFKLEVMAALVEGTYRPSPPHRGEVPGRTTIYEKEE